MYSNQSLPKAYGTSYAKGKSSGAGVVTQVALVVLLVLSGGLSLMHMSSKSQLRDTLLHHEALQEELTYTKNHLHHVEAQLANKEAEYTHLAQEVHQYSAHHSIQELETLRTQKRVADQTLATTQDEVKKLKEELDAAHALIDAYKHHLSDEVASHHQREETWMQVQQEWEKLEKELSAEIDSLRTQLLAAHVKIADNAQHQQHAHPQHVQPEVQKHDPLLDNLPPPHVETHQQQATTGSPAPAAAPTPAAAPVHSPSPAPAQHAAPVPVHTTAPVQHQHTHQEQHHVPSPAPAHATNPPHPAEAPHVHHNDHYQTHDSHATTDSGHSQEWKHTDYDGSWDAHNLYADYPGFVDEHQQHHDQHTGAHDAAQHNTWQHHDSSHNAHADHGHHAATTQQHTQQHHQEVPLPADTHATQQHHDAHATQQHHNAHATHHDAHATQQHHNAHATHHDAHATQQHTHVDPHAHHVVDDLAMKLGLAGHHEEHQPEQQWHH